MLCSVDNQSLIDFVNTQPLTNPHGYLGDGHDGIWNLIGELATPQMRWEILDWYHKPGKSLQSWGLAQQIFSGGEMMATF